jgi:hypothetical protein
MGLVNPAQAQCRSWSGAKGPDLAVQNFSNTMMTIIVKTCVFMSHVMLQFLVVKMDPSWEMANLPLSLFDLA